MYDSLHTIRQLYIASGSRAVGDAWASKTAKRNSRRHTFPSESPFSLFYHHPQHKTLVLFAWGFNCSIQHEFIEQGEKKILGRKPTQYTSLAGYAGGKSTDKEGRVCYHNFQGVADYGKLGTHIMFQYHLITNEL